MLKDYKSLREAIEDYSKLSRNWERVVAYRVQKACVDIYYWAFPKGSRALLELHRERIWVSRKYPTNTFGIRLVSIRGKKTCFLCSETRCFDAYIHAPAYPEELQKAKALIRTAVRVSKYSWYIDHVMQTWEKRMGEEASLNIIQ